MREMISLIFLRMMFQLYKQLGRNGITFISQHIPFRVCATAVSLRGNPSFQHGILVFVGALSFHTGLLWWRQSFCRNSGGLWLKVEGRK